jgi:hypothetical protein
MYSFLLSAELLAKDVTPVTGKPEVGRLKSPTLLG